MKTGRYLFYQSYCLLSLLMVMYMYIIHIRNVYDEYKSLSCSVVQLLIFVSEYLSAMTLKSDPSKNSLGWVNFHLSKDSSRFQLFTWDDLLHAAPYRLGTSPENKFLKLMLPKHCISSYSFSTSMGRQLKKRSEPTQDP